MDNFPPEVITLILSNLPVESILRCRAVCKTWRSIIDDPQFPELHFNISKSKCINNTSSLIFLPLNVHDIYTAKEDAFSPGNFIMVSKLHISSNRNTRSRFAQPPVGGLILSYSSSTYHTSSYDTSLGLDFCMYITNPATRACVKLPNCNPIHCKQAKLVRGFGFDTTSNQFKVVQIVTDVVDQLSATDSQVQVYTLGSDSWRNVARAPDMKILKPVSAFTNGSLHWLIICATDLSVSIRVLSFNLGFEEFALIPTPQNFLFTNETVVHYPDRFEIVALGECLSVVNSLFEDHIEIWVLKEYNVKESWTRCSVTKYYMHRVLFTVVLPISLRKNSEIVLLYGSSKLVSYDILSGNFTPLTVDGVPGYSPQYGISPYFYHIFAYVESLFSPGSTIE